jgi:hypothetical protein
MSELEADAGGEAEPVTSIAGLPASHQRRRVPDI